MRKLAIPQTYQPSSADEASALRVIAVTPAGSPDKAVQQVLEDDPDSVDGLERLAQRQPELSFILCGLIDVLDGLGYRNPSEGLMPLAREPL